MSDELTATVELPFRHRVRHGVRRPQNWFQLGRFVAVGASGYVVNLAVFAACVHVAGINYKLAAVTAFVVSVINNFFRRGSSRASARQRTAACRRRSRALELRSWLSGGARCSVSCTIRLGSPA